jgi:hypothetical protein
MRKLVVVLLVAGLAVALYASTAGGGQQAAVTPRQFAALKKQVATLQKQMKTAQKDITDLKTVAIGLIQCDFNSALPLTNAPNLHVTNPGEGTDAYFVTTTKDCADAMNTPAAALHRVLHR